jgi:hypothetical protein
VPQPSGRRSRSTTPVALLTHRCPHPDDVLQDAVVPETEFIDTSDIEVTSPGDVAPDASDHLVTTYSAVGADGAARNTPTQDVEGSTAGRDMTDAMKQQPTVIEGDIAMDVSKTNEVASCDSCIAFLGFIVAAKDTTDVEDDAQICSGKSSEHGSEVMCNMYREQDQRATIDFGVNSGIATRNFASDWTNVSTPHVKDAKPMPTRRLIQRHSQSALLKGLAHRRTLNYKSAVTRILVMALR